MPWNKLEKTDLKSMHHARLQLHQATQLIASAGISFAEQKEDDSHTSLTRLESLNVFCGAALGPQHIRLAISFSEMQFLLLDKEDKNLSHLHLHGRTEQESIDWFKSELHKYELSRFKLHD